MGDMTIQVWSADAPACGDCIVWRREKERKNTLQCRCPSHVSCQSHPSQHWMLLPVSSLLCVGHRRPAYQPRMLHSRDLHDLHVHSSSRKWRLSLCTLSPEPRLSLCTIYTLREVKKSTKVTYKFIWSSVPWSSYMMWNLVRWTSSRRQRIHSSNQFHSHRERHEDNPYSRALREGQWWITYMMWTLVKVTLKKLKIRSTEIGDGDQRL